MWMHRTLLTFLETSSTPAFALAPRIYCAAIPCLPLDGSALSTFCIVKTDSHERSVSTALVGT